MDKGMIRLAKAYKDPTAELAIGRICKTERTKKLLFKKAVLILAEVCGYRIRVEFLQKGEK
ncbi:hypothetical protein HMPREF1250_0010 [Megasphaera vaginalis (ex Srinivasan et al. 2021)]|uniref:Uncharacterized protein n=2 Tax=Megasphaera vaginalis (ex Srinivasan et al. 2021) TaxID=1111454 RepID=U7UBU0_9FIRM|nr:hypothetical protein HMPREF1250_0010 [Megasphaera vaginalis (ex Srinivasan et al. 2021)]